MYLAIVAVAFLSVSCVQAKDEAGPVAPDFSLPDLNQTPVALSSYIGKQAVLLFFWTTWCPFCQRQLKVLNEKYDEMLKDNLEVLAIDVGESREKVASFLKNYFLAYRVLLDRNTMAAKSYRVFGVPTYILIDKKGNILFKGSGFPYDYRRLIFE
jgi:peroxiredoxin